MADDKEDSLQATLADLAALDLAKVDSSAMAVEGAKEKAGTHSPEIAVAETKKSKGGKESQRGGASDGQSSSGDTELTYSSKELRRLRESKAAKKWPDFLDEDFKNQRGVWDPDRWHQGRRRGLTPPPTENAGKDGRTEDGAFYQQVMMLTHLFPWSELFPSSEVTHKKRPRIGGRS